MPFPSIGTSSGSKKWLSLDACGLGCSTLSYSFHLYALVTIYNYLIAGSNPATYIFYALYLPCSILAVSNLFSAQHTDPGAIPIGARPLPIEDEDDENNSVASSLLDGVDVSRVVPKNIRRRRGVRRCRKCNNNYKPPRSHHDSVTGRCISKFDHYCPWVGNAVGALNHKFFVLFIFYTNLTSGISLILILMKFIRCGFVVDEYQPGFNQTMHNETGMSTPQTVNGTIRFLDEDEGHEFLYEGCSQIYSIRIAILFVMTICFLVFTCCMLFEQVDAIESNTSKIAKMKIKMGNDNGEYAKVAKGYNEMFGVGNGIDTSRVGLHWFLPTQVNFPEGERDKVLGFEYYEIWNGKIYDEDEENGPPICTMLPASQGRERQSSALMASDSDHDDGVGEIELPAGNGARLIDSNRKID